MQDKASDSLLQDEGAGGTRGEGHKKMEERPEGVLLMEIGRAHV